MGNETLTIQCLLSSGTTTASLVAGGLEFDLNIRTGGANQ